MLRIPALVLMVIGSSPAPAAPQHSLERGVAFEVLLDGRRVGTHRFDFQALADDRLQVTSRASFDVRILGITLFRYRHEANEHWQQGCLSRVDARTEENGKVLQVRGESEAGVFRLDLPRSLREARECVRAYAYWDPARLLQDQQLLNPQTGEFETVGIQRLPEEQITVLGSSVIAQRYRLRRSLGDIHLWYSRAGEWLQLERKVRDARSLHYRRIE